MGKKLVIAVLVVVVLLGAGVYWFVVRDDAPAELTLDSGDGTTATGTAPDTFDGQWVVRDGGDTTAGFRIDEEFAGALTHTAVGRSPAVEGSLDVEGTQVPAADVTVDLTQLEFTDDPPTGTVGNRAGAMAGNGLQTDEFPEASFTLTEPIDLAGQPAEGFSHHRRGHRRPDPPRRHPARHLLRRRRRPGRHHPHRHHRPGGGGPGRLRHRGPHPGLRRQRRGGGLLRVPRGVREGLTRLSPGPGPRPSGPPARPARCGAARPRTATAPRRSPASRRWPPARPGWRRGPG